MMRLSPRKQLLAQLMDTDRHLGRRAHVRVVRGDVPDRRRAVPRARGGGVARGRGGADRAGRRRSPGGGQGAHGIRLALFTAWVRTVERAAENRPETNPNSRAARWIKRLMISPTSGGDSVHHPPGVFHDDRRRGHRFGILGAAEPGAPRGSRRDAASGLLAGAGVMGVSPRWCPWRSGPPRRKRDIICARVNVMSVKLFNVIGVASVLHIERRVLNSRLLQKCHQNDELSAPESSARTWRGMGSSGEDGSCRSLGRLSR